MIRSKLPATSPLLMLAPMEGLTNFGMRELLISQGSIDVVATEFVRITSARQRIAPFQRHTSTPLQIQFMASDIGAIRGVIENLKTREILFEDDWIDLNVGCPSRRVNSRGAGAALLLEPEKLMLMICQMREVHETGLLSMKTRLGYNSSEEFPRILECLKGAPLDLITIHARSKCTAYDPNSLQIDKLKQAAEELPYPVIGNGDVTTPEAATRMLSTGVSGVMCGRGALINPYLFCEIRAALEGRASDFDDKDLTPSLWQFALSYLHYLQGKEHAENSNSQIGSFKEFATWLSRNPYIGRNFFDEIKRMSSLKEIENFLIKSTPTLSAPGSQNNSVYSNMF